MFYVSLVVGLLSSVHCFLLPLCGGFLLLINIDNPYFEQNLCKAYISCTTLVK